MDARAIVVLNGDRKPIGTLLLRNAMSLSDRQLRTYKVADVMWDEPIIVSEKENALDLAALFKEKNIPIVAVVDSQGLLEGTIMEKEILRRNRYFTRKTARGGEWKRFVEPSFTRLIIDSTTLDLASA